MECKKNQINSLEPAMKIENQRSPEKLRVLGPPIFLNNPIFSLNDETKLETKVPFDAIFPSFFHVTQFQLEKIVPNFVQVMLDVCAVFQETGLGFGDFADGFSLVEDVGALVRTVVLSPGALLGILIDG